MWRVPRMWQDGECWIIGGGVSITQQFEIPSEVVQGVLNKTAPLSSYSPYMSAIHDKHIIGINAAYLLGNWVDMLFYGDNKFFLQNRELIAKFTGLKVSCHAHAVNFESENVKYLGKDNEHTRGISSDPYRVSWNQNSGAAAISVAAHTGVKRIVLVGFDMKLGENERQHWHSQYGTAEKKNRNLRRLPFRRHLIGFEQIAKDARKMGIEILNACPDSAITEFKKLTVKEALEV